MTARSTNMVLNLSCSWQFRSFQTRHLYRKWNIQSSSWWTVLSFLWVMLPLWLSKFKKKKNFKCWLLCQHLLNTSLSICHKCSKIGLKRILHHRGLAHITKETTDLQFLKTHCLDDLHKTWIQLLTHPAYSPGLVPCDHVITSCSQKWRGGYRDKILRMLKR